MPNDSTSQADAQPSDEKQETAQEIRKWLRDNHKPIHWYPNMASVLFRWERTYEERKRLERELKSSSESTESTKKLSTPSSRNDNTSGTPESDLKHSTSSDSTKLSIVSGKDDTSGTPKLDLTGELMQLAHAQVLFSPGPTVGPKFTSDSTIPTSHRSLGPSPR